VRFDDRLLTVLNQPASDRHDTAVRWRQLVDLVARAGPNSTSAVVGRALDAIRADAGIVEEPLRAAAARAVAALPLPLGLLECFAADKLAVSAPVLAAATLQPSQWRALLDGADSETRRFVETLHPDIAETPQPVVTVTVAETVAPRVAEREPQLIAGPVTPTFEPTVPFPERTEPTVSEPPAVREPETPALHGGKSLHDVVERIERRRRSREPFGSLSREQSHEAPTSGPSVFRWECQPSGEIAWVDGAPRGALIGRSIARPDDGSNREGERELARAFAMRAPFRDAALVIPGDGLVSGEWKFSGVPAFDPADGRFAGYRGIAMRDVAAPAATQAASFSQDILADPDSLRELVHEIKTPLNAIIGFAEIIDGQFLGPADRRYRERAADIVVQAKLLLSAIDDLDFAAQLHSSSSSGLRRSDLGEQIHSLAVSLRELADGRNVDLDIQRPATALPCHVEPELLDRLLYRLCATLIERARSGERLRLTVDQGKGTCRFSISRPEALRSATEHQLFDASSAGEGSELRVGFTLRLVRGLARIAGGDLVATQSALTLSLPSS